jgi:hypothetical protein
MAEKRNDTSPGPEDAKPDNGALRGRLIGCIPFVAGLVAALAIGWWVYPALLFAKLQQPAPFNHQAHLVKVGMACSDCHTLRDDGSFRGLLSTADCAVCHAAAQTDSPREKKFIADYVAKGREVRWLVHQKQPDNVFFSHAAHFGKCYSCHLTMKGRLNLGTPADPQKLCMNCHPSVDALNKNIPVETHVLTGYSRTTKKMGECESCHAHPGHFSNDGKGRTVANNACYTCHK